MYMKIDLDTEKFSSAPWELVIWVYSRSSYFKKLFMFNSTCESEIAVDVDLRLCSCGAS